MFLATQLCSGEMAVDPLDDFIEGWPYGHRAYEDSNDVPFVDFVEATNDWNNFGDQLATTLWNHVYV